MDFTDRGFRNMIDFAENPRNPRKKSGQSVIKVLFLKLRVYIYKTYILHEQKITQCHLHHKHNYYCGRDYYIFYKRRWCLSTTKNKKIYDPPPKRRVSF